jgi:cytochrome b
VRPPVTVKVWDVFIRAFHWSLVTLFIIAYATGDETERVHIAAGYAISGLLVLRTAWGVVGPRYAQFSTFVRTPREIFAYLRDVALHRAPRYLGHNPAGGAMILALITVLVATCITGYMMTTDAYWGSKWLEHVHEALANVTVVLIVFHVLGVLFASFEYRENLVKAMITGRKRAL